MYIIKIKAKENGARPPIQTWNKPTLPEGYAICPDELYAVFYSTTPAGFVNIEVEDDVVVGMAVNEEALEAYIASIPEPVITPEEEIAELKAKLAATDYQAIKYAEGVLSEEEYSDMKAQRQLWRDRINELEEVVYE
ncbi:MAG: hypothetical protein IKA62_06290 [Clostridia bacterium]|nr:hypothetical protein [Clostridia bacterium]